MPEWKTTVTEMKNSWRDSQQIEGGRRKNNQ